ncbi:MAG: hypothetical protein WCI04_06275 [archaeon]
MEERIVDYTDSKDVDAIIEEHQNNKFLFVKHSSRTKQLHFKKYPTQPETLIGSDQ